MYRESIITFVDILGFKDIIQKSSSEAVLKILKRIERFSGLEYSSDGEDFSPKIIQFSDSIIRVRPLDSKANLEFRYGALFHELNDLVIMQGELVNHGICIRGGLTVGKIHFDNQNVYGPGFVRAYEIESGFSNYPRIVIDPEVIKKITTDNRLLSAHNDIEYELQAINEQLRKGSDGLYFIDYLGAFPHNVDDPDFIPDFFSNNKKTIIENLSKHNSLSSITSKYLWLATYHNDVLNGLFERVEETEDMWITSEEAPLLATIK